jgi:hypothetical protein
MDMQNLFYCFSDNILNEIDKLNNTNDKYNNILKFDMNYINNTTKSSFSFLCKRESEPYIVSTKIIRDDQNNPLYYKYTKKELESEKKTISFACCYEGEGVDFIEAIKSYVKQLINEKGFVFIVKELSIDYNITYKHLIVKITYFE